MNPRRPNLYFESLRYLLYFLDLTFGTLMWGLAIDLRSLDGYSNKCIPFNIEQILDAPDGNVELPVESSPICNIILGLGVVCTFFLLLIIIWHTLIFLRRPFLPYILESILFFLISKVWLALAIVALAKSSNRARYNISNLRVCIASGWVAYGTHLVSSFIALVQHFVTRKRRKDSTVKATTTSGTTNGRPVNPSQGANAQPWEGVKTNLQGGYPDTNRTPPNIQARVNG